MVRAKFDAILGELREAGNVIEIEGMPSSLSGKAKYLIDVNDSETGFEFSDTLEFDDCTFIARSEPSTPIADSIVVYVTSSGTSPNKVVEWKIKNELGQEVILHSMKI